MKSLHVDLKEHSYEIHIGKDLLRKAGEIIKRIYKGDKIAVVTDEKVFGLYGERLIGILGEAGFSACPIVVKPGEESKSPAVLEWVYNELAAYELSRGDLIAAFGGGVVGDLAGFAAATYMRGTPYIQIPTTLLAQVDSSVGGKTAVNLPAGKNLVGAFRQPAAVISDCSLLNTLDERQKSGGFAEVIKYAAISSGPLFDLLSSPSAGEELPDIIYQCCDIKRALVEADQFDQNERMILNFGHTFGHAIEKEKNYEMIHGEAVAAGMVIASLAGEELGVTKAGTAGRIKELLSQYGLAFEPVDLQNLVPLMMLDKKKADGDIRLILLEEIGKAVIYPVAPKRLAELMERGQKCWMA